MDGGRSWVPAASKLPFPDNRSGLPLFHFFNLQNGLAADSNPQGLLQIRTNDYGATWQVQERKPLPGSAERLLTYIFPKEGWYVPRNQAGAAIEVYRMTDGANWYKISMIDKGKEMNEVPVALTFTSRKRGLLLTKSPVAGGAAAWHLWESVDSGKTWIDHTFPADLQLNDPQVRMTFADSNHGWLATPQGTLRTEDGGNNWTWLD
jgi:photosystem II stability/assembly factor-like uncharacterized protein